MGEQEHWRLAVRVHAGSIVCELLPDDTLRSSKELTGTVWESDGDHAGFRFGPPVADAGLPAGWYQLRGRIECLQGTVTLPSLQPVYAHQGNAAEEIALPEPSRSGELRTLVLFKYPVSGLRFCPGVWAARFRLHDFALRRVSRLAAWRMMLGCNEPTEANGGVLRRTFDFMARLRSDGLQAATEQAFADYADRLRPPELAEYDLWIRKYDTFTTSRMVELQARLASVAAAKVVLSVLLPVRQISVQQLLRCINGVRQQLWTDWELCVVADASCDAAIMDFLAQQAVEEPRIRLAPTVAADATVAFNRALGMATADHVVIFGADIGLRRHALLEMVEVCRCAPDVAFVYADEDRIDPEGRRFEPYFKPDWNPDLLRGHDYVGAFAMIRADVLRAAGGLRDGFGDDGEHDLHLRCTEGLQPSQIFHVPHVLYHRYGSAEKLGDMAMGSARAVAEHLARRGVSAEVDARPNHTFHVRWPLPSRRPKISLVIPTRDRADLLRTCVESILAGTNWSNLEIVVVDNHSTERDTLDYLDELRRRDRVRVLRDEAPFNYAAINNRAIEQCDGELVCLINNDIEVISPNWLREMAGHALRPEIGAVGAMLYYPNETIQHAGVIVGLHGVADHIAVGRPRGWPGHGGRLRVAQELSAVTAACLLVRRAAYLQVGGLDEQLAVAFNDIDFCLRLRESGYRNIWTPFAELYHHESASRGSDETPARKARFDAEILFMKKRWGKQMRRDPAYSPNLTLQGVDFDLAFPPRAASRPIMALGEKKRP